MRVKPTARFTGMHNGWALESKGIRRVRTPEGAKRFKMPIGSIIVAGGPSLNVNDLTPEDADRYKLANLKLEDSEFEGFDKVRTSKGRVLYIGKFPGEDEVTVNDEDDNELDSFDSVEEAFKWADKHGDSAAYDDTPEERAVKIANGSNAGGTTRPPERPPVKPRPKPKPETPKKPETPAGGESRPLHVGADGKPIAKGDMVQSRIGLAQYLVEDTYPNGDLKLRSVRDNWTLSETTPSLRAPASEFTSMGNYDANFKGKRKQGQMLNGDIVLDENGTRYVVQYAGDPSGNVTLKKVGKGGKGQGRIIVKKKSELRLEREQETSKPEEPKAGAVPTREQMHSSGTEDDRSVRSANRDKYRELSAAAAERGEPIDNINREGAKALWRKVETDGHAAAAKKSKPLQAEAREQYYLDASRDLVAAGVSSEEERKDLDGFLHHQALREDGSTAAKLFYDLRDELAKQKLKKTETPGEKPKTRTTIANPTAEKGEFGRYPIGKTRDELTDGDMIRVNGKLFYATGPYDQFRKQLPGYYVDETGGKLRGVKAGKKQFQGIEGDIDGMEHVGDIWTGEKGSQDYTVDSGVYIRPRGKGSYQSWEIAFREGDNVTLVPRSAGQGITGRTRTDTAKVSDLVLEPHYERTIFGGWASKTNADKMLEGVKKDIPDSLAPGTVVRIGNGKKEYQVYEHRYGVASMKPVDGKGGWKSVSGDDLDNLKPVRTIPGRIDVDAEGNKTFTSQESIDRAAAEEKQLRDDIDAGISNPQELGNMNLEEAKDLQRRLRNIGSNLPSQEERDKAEYMSYAVVAHLKELENGADNRNGADIARYREYMSNDSGSMDGYYQEQLELAQQGNALDWDLDKLLQITSTRAERDPAVARVVKGARPFIIAGDMKGLQEHLANASNDKDIRIAKLRHDAYVLERLQKEASSLVLNRQRFGLPQPGAVQELAGNAIGQSDEMRIARAEAMFGTDSPQHRAAIARYGRKEDGDMQTLDYKATPVSGVRDSTEKEGVVTAIVSVTGIKDNVHDIILPGAFQKSLATRTPKGVWHHSIQESVARTQEIKELPPGDPELPEELPNGKPWPREAGALLVKMEFNLKTQRGRDAYEDVKFFGTDQEWSIGYNVPTGGATIDRKAGVRKIETLDLYEYSPVLFGAMPNARTQSVKSAQQAWATIASLDSNDPHDMEIKSLFDELIEEQNQAAFDTKGGKKPMPPWLKDKMGKDKDGDDDGGKDDAESSSGEDDDDEPKGRKKKRPDADVADGKGKWPFGNKKKGSKSGFSPETVDLLDNAVKSLGDLRDAIVAEYKADDPDDDGDDDSGNGDGEMVSLFEDAGLEDMDAAEQFDQAVEAGDDDAIVEAGSAVLDAVEAADEDAADSGAIKAIIGAVTKHVNAGNGSGDSEEEKPSDNEDQGEPTEEKSGVSKGSTVSWSWSGSTASGKVQSVHKDSITRTLGGKEITKNGTPDNPAVVIKQDDGTTVIKLASELKTGAQITESKSVVINPQDFLALLDD